MQGQFSCFVISHIFYRYFIYLRTYSRWIDDIGRRELWQESIKRYMDFMKENLGNKLSDKEYKEIQNAILNQEVMGSMRLLWAAGDPCRKNNATAYNCWFCSIDDLKRFSEIFR